MHVSLFRLFRYPVYGLSFAERSQGSYGKDLCLSSLEKSGAVGPWEYSRFTPYRSDFRPLSVVRSYLIVQDQASHLFLGYSIEHIVYVLAVFRIYLLKMLLGLSFHRIHVVQSFHLIVSLDGGPHLVFSIFSDSSLYVFRDLVKIQLHLRLADFFHYLLDEFDDFLYLLVSEHDGVQDSLLRHFVGSGFNHHDSVLRSRHYQVHGAFLPLSERRIYDKLTVHHTNEDRSCRTIPWNIRYSQRYRRSYHSSYLCRRIQIHAHDCGYYLHIVEKPLRKQRSQRPVHQP